MKKKWFLIALFCWLQVVAYTQPDPNKVLAEAQRKIDSVMKNNPDLKKYANQKNLPSNNPASLPNMPTNASMANAFARKPDTAFLSRIKLPDRNDRALATIPAKTLSRKDLVSYITDTKKKFMTGLGITPVAVGDATATSLSNGGVMCWYGGNSERGMELALDAAEKDPDDMNALDNLSGLLTMCGYPYRAVPILEYVAQQDPGNSTVNNNLGQAYFQMGEVQKAKAYFSKATADYQYHPHANFALACIEYANGNKSAAQRYCENCLKGAYIGDAWTMLKSIDPKAKLMELIRYRFKQPDYFNPHKYPLPEQCRLPEEAQKKLVEFTQYKNMLLAMKEKYRRMQKAEKDYISKNLANDMMKKIQQQQNPLRPFGGFAVMVMGDIDVSHGEDLMRLQEYDSAYRKNMKALMDQYLQERENVLKPFKERSDKAGEGNPDITLEKEMCDAENGVAANYLPQFANLNEARQEKWLTLTKNYYNDYIYWSYLASVDDHQYKDLYFQMIIEYLDMLYNLATSEFVSCKGHYTYTKEKSAELEFKEGKCPFEAKIDVEVENEDGKTEKPAKFEIDCEKFSGEFDLGLASLNIKTMRGGATTIAINAGLSKKVGKILPVSVSGNMGVSLTFGGGQPADIGIDWDYSMKLPEGLGGKNSAGWGISLNTNLDPNIVFRGKGNVQKPVSEWVTKNLFGQDPPASQVNPNIKMYNNGGGTKN